jgi:peptidoglycan-N-acetylglucosamine deacetylase
MDDSITTLRRRPGGPPPASAQRGPQRRRVQPHHRRRRLVALLVLLALIVIIAIALGSGGSSPSTPVPAAAHVTTGYFTRIETLAGTGPGSFAGAEKVAANNAINKTLAYTPYVAIAGAQHKEVALTFDDGPGPYTPQFVALLKQYHVPATFFEVGLAEPDFHQGTTLVAQAGFPIGDHTFNHYAMSHLSTGDQQNQLNQQIAATSKYGAPYPRLFRPPYGLWNQSTLGILKQMHMLMVMWTVDTSDYQLPGTAAIVQRAVSGARPGAIILMHDAGGNRAETLAALPIIIKDLRAKGYTMVTVPKLILDNPPPANQNLDALSGSGG